MRVLILDTIGALIDGNMVLRAYCNNPKCHHCVLLDLEVLAVTLGRDHGCLHKDLVPKLKCSTCGSRDVSLTRWVTKALNFRSQLTHHIPDLNVVLFAHVPKGPRVRIYHLDHTEYVKKDTREASQLD